MPDPQITVTNPRTDDVRVIPAELAKQYEARGWTKVTAKATAKDGSAGK